MTLNPIHSDDPNLGVALTFVPLSELQVSITNFTSLKLHPVMTSQVRSLGLAELGSVLRASRGEMKVSAGLHSPLIDRFYQGRLPSEPSSKLMEAVGRIQFLVVIGLRSCYLPGYRQWLPVAPRGWPRVLAITWLLTSMAAYTECAQVGGNFGSCIS